MNSLTLLRGEIRRDRVVWDVFVDSPDKAFRDFVWLTLDDPKGWRSRGYRFQRSSSAERADVTVKLVMPVPCDGIDPDLNCFHALHNTVYVNADRWKHGSDTYTGSLQQYRQYVINHEIGHALGRDHVPLGQCDPEGHARVMSQQTRGLHGCKPKSVPHALDGGPRKRLALLMRDFFS